MRKGVYFTSGVMGAYFVSAVPFLISGLRLPGVWRMFVGVYLICVFLGLCGCVAALMDRFEGLRAFALIPLWMVAGTFETADFSIQFPSPLKFAVIVDFGHVRLGLDATALGILLVLIVLTWRTQKIDTATAQDAIADTEAAPSSDMPHAEVPPTDGT
jgi:hypothetical protein